jgi:hypothetical protein
MMVDPDGNPLVGSQHSRVTTEPNHAACPRVLRSARG